jgi:Ca2+-binding EF-hand superfamily protein/predicted ferric reductase
MNTEKCLKLWRDRILITKRKELSPSEVASLFQEKDLQEAFFQIVDRDANGSLSIEEWTGCFSKLIGDGDVSDMNWFVDKFNQRCTDMNKLYLDVNDLDSITADVEFGYRFGTIISPRARRINCVQLITSLEIIACMSTDSKWLSWLKYQFTEAMIQSNRYSNMEMYVTLEDFQENFYFKEPFLAARIFYYLDKDKSGTLSLHEFINGLEVVVNGSQEEKMEFLFKAFDIDNDGTLDYNELRMMLKCCLEESPSLEIEETVDDLASVLFKDIDKDDSGDITLAELKQAFKQNEALFKSLSVCTSIWIKPKFINKIGKRSLFGQIKDFIVNKKALVFFWGIYTIISLLCIGAAYYNYEDSGNWKLIGARVFGQLLNFNCALILVLVLRKHFTWFRIKGGASYLPVDDFIDIHKKIGVIIFIYSLIHTIFHLINLYFVCIAMNYNYFTLLFTGYTPDDVKIGFPTGVILLFLLFIIVFFATPMVRKRGYFELFYWFHMLTIPFLVIMLSHGLKFWVWIMFPGICFAVEKILRYRKVRSNKFGDTVISEAYILPSKVTHLVIRKPPKFKFKSGDYIYVNIPAIAKNEWHPFSISSAPQKSDNIWLHIRAIGNWTNKLYQYSKSSKFDTSISSNMSAHSATARRLTMRARMSKVFNDSQDFFPKTGPKAIDNNNDNDNENHHSKGKKVCFISKTSLNENNSKCENENESNEENKIIENNEPNKDLDLLNLENNNNNNNSNNNENDNSTGSTTEQKQPANTAKPKHKGILKLISENKSSNNNNNFKTFSFNDNNLSFNELPTESTPKSISSTSKITSNNNNKDDLPEQQVVSINNTEPTSANKYPQQPITNLNKNKSKSSNIEKDGPIVMDGQNENPLAKVKSLDFAGMNEMNIAADYFMKDKQVMIDKIADKPFIDSNNKDQQVMLVMNDEDQKQNEESEIQNSNEDSSDNFQVVIKDFRGSKKSSLVKYQQEENPKKDELGYLKMYQKPNRVNIDTIGGDDVWRLKVLIDGPYGTPSHHIFDSEHAVLIAAGIGITPFASILQSLMFRYRQARATCPNCDYKLSDQYVSNNDKLNVKKVDFIWITREQRSLEWFISLLSQMEIEQKKNDENFMETHLYVTSAKRQSDLRTIGLHLTLDAIFSKEESSLIDGLRQRTHYGRPNWDIVMQSLIRKQKGKINVFYCGPPSLAMILGNKCHEYSLNFKKEIF